MHRQALLLSVLMGKRARVNGGEAQTGRERRREQREGRGLSSGVQRRGSDGEITSCPRDRCSSFGAVRNDS